MKPLVVIFLLAGVVMLAIGAYLSRGLPPIIKYKSESESRTFGHMCLILSLLPFALAYVTQYYSSDESVPATPSISVSDLPPSVAQINNPATAAAPESIVSQAPEVIPTATLLQQAVNYLQLNQPDDAMGKVNDALQADPKNWAVYFVRGNIYAVTKQWDKAEADYKTASQMNDQNSSIKYNMADINFIQKKYALARAGFIALEQDPTLGDQCTYKVFLCDLYAGQEDVASKELDALNQVGSKASYYFANAAWSLYHQKTDEAQGWLTSANKIYSPEKFKRYSASLDVLGYPDKLNQSSSPTAPTLPDDSAQK